MAFCCFVHGAREGQTERVGASIMTGSQQSSLPHRWHRVGTGQPLALQLGGFTELNHTRLLRYMLRQHWGDFPA
jgi:hypothetical protein